MSELEHLETLETTIRYEWRLGNLKGLFEPGENVSKSLVEHSPVFGGGRWMIRFSLGRKDPDYVGLYLCAVPTSEERDQFPDKWVRDGRYTYTIELRNPDSEKSLLLLGRAKGGHSFSTEDKNSGWNRLVTRENIYFKNSIVKKADSVIIVCTINSKNTVPMTFQLSSRPMPTSQIYAIGKLLDDPTYSDVEFILPGRQQTKKPRRIVAARKLLESTTYFVTLFNSEFCEASAWNAKDVSLFESDESANSSRPLIRDFYDSDCSDDENEEEKEEEELPQAQREGSTQTSSATPNANPNIEGSSNEASGVKKDTDVSNSSTSHSGDDKRYRNQVVVRDVAYATYYAILYFIYIDIIIFAPLSSSFSSSASQDSDGDGQVATSAKWKNRRQWIRSWRKHHGTFRPAPCSAKSVYRLADRLGMSHVKERAFQFIVKSLTVDNIVNEIFSYFSMVHDEVQKAQIEFFVNNWDAIRSSEAMKKVWKQIRIGGHPGFEEVWPIIMSRI